MRTRNRNTTVDQTAYKTVSMVSSSRPRNGAIALANDFESVTHKAPVIDEMTDGVTPGYFKSKRDGKLLPTSPLLVNRYEEEIGYIRLSSVREINPYANPPTYSTWKYAVSQVPRIPDVMPNLISNQDIQTIAQAAKARMASDGIDWATSALELGKTISMITGLRKSIIRLITRILDSLRDRRFKSFAELYAAFSSAWLEGRFGWRILYYEIKSLYDYLDTIGEDHKKFFARETINAKLSQSSQGIIVNSNDIHVSWTQTTDFSATATVGYVGVGDLSKPGGFNVLNTIWEVLPFTVVLDMFFNFQDIILTWAPHASRVSDFQPGSFLTLTQSATAVRNFDGEIAGSNAVYEPIVWDSKPGLATRTRITRSVAPSSPFSFDFSPQLRGLKKVDLMAFMGPLYKAFIK